MPPHDPLQIERTRGIMAADDARAPVPLTHEVGTLDESGATQPLIDALIAMIDGLAVIADGFVFGPDDKPVRRFAASEMRDIARRALDLARLRPTAAAARPDPETPSLGAGRDREFDGEPNP